MQEFEGRHLVYVAAGTDPYSVIENSVKYVKFRLFLEWINVRTVRVVTFGDLNGNASRLFSFKTHIVLYLSL